MCRPLLHFPHNYNYVTRALMYNWMNRHLGLGLKEPIVEEDFHPLTPEERTVWNDEHPAPKGGPEVERALTKYMDEASNRQLADLVPTDGPSLDKYRSVVGAAVDTIIGRRLPGADEIQRTKIDKQNRGDYLELKDIVRLGTRGETLPVVSLYPNETQWNGQAVIWIDGRGKEGMYDDQGQPRPEIRRLLAAGSAVLSADLLYQGEFLSDGKPITETRVVSNPREYAGFTFAYNDTLFAQRVHDILTLVAFVRHDPHQPHQVHLVGVNGAGPWVAAARAQAGAAVDRAAIDTQGFRFAELTTYRDVNFLPGAVKYGDLPALLALSAPHPLALAGEGAEAEKVPEIVSAAYQASGKPDNVQLMAGKPTQTADALSEWLVKP
jgi:hypothetical protein